MSHVFYRQPKHQYPVAVRGEGCLIIDRDGNRYLDASGGAAVSCLGHDHPRVIAAIKAQVERPSPTPTAASSRPSPRRRSPTI
jgi:4-aminobutyrate aminotransferase-like enzyme